MSKYVPEHALVDLVYSYEDLGVFLGRFRAFMRTSPHVNTKLSELGIKTKSPKITNAFNEPCASGLSATPRDGLSEILFNGGSINEGLTLGDAFEKLAKAIKTFPDERCVATRQSYRQSFVDHFFPGMNPSSVLKLDNAKAGSGTTFYDVMYLFLPMKLMSKNMAGLAKLRVNEDEALKKVVSDMRAGNDVGDGKLEVDLFGEFFMYVSLMHCACTALLLYSCMDQWIPFFEAEWV